MTDGQTSLAADMEDEDIDTAWDSLFSGRDPSAPALTDLSIGAPGQELLCRLPALFLQAAQHRLGRDQGEIFQYGPEVGIAAFRAQLARCQP